MLYCSNCQFKKHSPLPPHLTYTMMKCGTVSDFNMGEFVYLTGFVHSYRLLQTLRSTLYSSLFLCNGEVLSSGDSSRVLVCRIGMFFFFSINSLEIFYLKKFDSVACNFSKINENKLYF